MEKKGDWKRNKRNTLFVYIFKLESWKYFIFLPLFFYFWEDPSSAFSVKISLPDQSNLYPMEMIWNLQICKTSKDLNALSDTYLQLDSFGKTHFKNNALLFFNSSWSIRECVLRIIFSELISLKNINFAVDLQTIWIIYSPLWSLASHLLFN